MSNTPVINYCKARNFSDMELLLLLMTTRFRGKKLPRNVNTSLLILAVLRLNHFEAFKLLEPLPSAKFARISHHTREFLVSEYTFGISYARRLLTFLFKQLSSKGYFIAVHKFLAIQLLFKFKISSVQDNVIKTRSVIIILSWKSSLVVDDCGSSATSGYNSGISTRMIIS